jgi:hypothetical protein
LLHHLTDWIGDDGFIQNHQCQIRRHNVVGEIVYINGEVTERVVEPDGTVFVITQKATNQDGELSATGIGRVKLPNRS